MFSPTFDEIYATHEGFVWRLIRKGLHEAYATYAEDICQQVWIQLHTSLPDKTFENEAAFRGYLRRIVKGKICNQIRYLKADRRNIDCEEGSAAFVAGEAKPRAAHEYDSYEETLRYILTTCRTEDEALIVILRLAWNWTFARISECVSYTGGGCRTTLEKIMRRTRRKATMPWTSRGGVHRRPNVVPSTLNPPS